MRSVQLIGVTLALLLLAAHFSRAGQTPLLYLMVSLLILVPVRLPWAGRALQAALVLGTLEWLRTAGYLARLRYEAGAPYMRMALILAAVAAFTAAMALSFEGRSMRRHFRLDPIDARRREEPTERDSEALGESEATR